MEKNKMVTTAWVAGVFEGEGSTIISGNRITVSVQMTDKDILERIMTAFGGKIYVCKKQLEHHKDSWKWTISSSVSAIKFLDEIYPFMGIRRKARIEQAREAFKSHRSNRVNDKVARAKELRESGMTHQAIADEMGVERSYVSHMLRGRHD